MSRSSRKLPSRSDSARRPPQTAIDAVRYADPISPPRGDMRSYRCKAISTADCGRRPCRPRRAEPPARTRPMAARRRWTPNAPAPGRFLLQRTAPRRPAIAPAVASRVRSSKARRAASSVQIAWQSRQARSAARPGPAVPWVTSSVGSFVAAAVPDPAVPWAMSKAV